MELNKQATESANEWEREKSKSKSKFRVSFYLHSSTEIKHSFPFRAVKLWEIYLVSKQLRSGFATAGMSSLSGSRERGPSLGAESDYCWPNAERSRLFGTQAASSVLLSLHCWEIEQSPRNQNKISTQTRGFFRVPFQLLSLTLYYFIFFSSRSPPLFRSNVTIRN